MRGFINTVYRYYRENKRDLPWRKQITPYKVFVSEIMLQQTQVPRVIDKFNQWIKQYPTLIDLSNASFQDIITLWSGLGYNRRAKYIHTAAQLFVQKHSGTIPNDYDVLITIPGFGNATAQAIRCYAYNEPVVFIETNIRTVYLHHFFAKSSNVSDKDLLPFIQKTLDMKNPREWYWALMDYGSYLKSSAKNPSRKSKHYSKQSKFEGSTRQTRGKILTNIIEHGSITYPNGTLQQKAIEGLIKDGLIEKEKGVLIIKRG